MSDGRGGRHRGQTGKAAIIIGLRSDSSDARRLSADLGYGILDEIQQQLPSPSRDTYLGKGKIEEVRARLDALPEGVQVIVSGDLSPRQHFELEKRLGRTVKDRIRLILEAFEQGAQGKVAKMEVKLAHLEFEIPYLREYAHLVTQSEKAGFYAGGEQRVDVYLQQIRRERQKILRDLKAERNMKEIWAARRRELGFFQISFAGFTNSGKTTLFNLMTRSSETVSPRLFTTLETRTAGAAIQSWGPVLFSDTVGFFSDLPPWIFKAFESTLDELFNSDGLVVMVDGSKTRPEILAEAGKSLAIVEGRVVPQKLVLLLNKSDAHAPDELGEILSDLNASTLAIGSSWITVSCKDPKRARESLKAAILSRWFRTRVVIPCDTAEYHEASRELSKLGILESIQEDPALARFRVNEGNMQRIGSLLESHGVKGWRTELAGGDGEFDKHYA